MYKCEFFHITELVPKQVWEDRGEKAWELLRPEGLETIDALRRKFGPIIINNWYYGGPRSESGLRTPDCVNYSKYSQHSLGNAFDCLFKDVSVDDVRVYVIANPTEFPHTHGIELGVSWLHIDFRNFEGQLLFKKG